MGRLERGVQRGGRQEDEHQRDDGQGLAAQHEGHDQSVQGEAQRPEFPGGALAFEHEG